MPLTYKRISTNLVINPVEILFGCNKQQTTKQIKISESGITENL